MQVPAALGLPHEAAAAIQAAASTCSGLLDASPVRTVVKGALNSVLQFGLAGAGLHGAFSGWRRCIPWVLDAAFPLWWSLPFSPGGFYEWHAIAADSRICLEHLQQVVCVDSDAQPWRTPLGPSQSPALDRVPLAYLLLSHLQFTAEELCWKCCISTAREPPRNSS